MGLLSFSGQDIYRKRLTGDIKALLEERFDFIWVEAEISNFRSPSSGHYYMVLKDEDARSGRSCSVPGQVSGILSLKTG